MLPVLFGGLFTVVSAWCAGRAICRKHPEWPWGIVFGAGAVALSQVLLALHLAGWVNRWSLGALGLLCIVAGRRLPVFRRPDRAWLAGAPIFLLYAVHALAPEIEPDAITYHLGLVAEWNREGGFTPRVGFYEVLPQGVEMLFSMAFAYGGHSAAKLVHFAFLIAATGLVAETARRLGTRHGIAAGIFVAGTPVIGVTGTSAYNDVALAFYLLAAFYALWMWRREGEKAWLVAAGAFAGFSYAVKLTGLLAAAAIPAYVVLRRKWHEAAVAAGLAVATGGPWMLRAWAISGNPVAPLFNHVFENPHFHVSTQESLTEFLRNYGLAPLDLVQETTLGGVRTGGFTGPLFLLAPVGLLALRRREGRWLWFACVAVLVPWWLNAGTRFLIPSLVFLALVMFAVLPRGAAWALVALQCAMAWPGVIELWTNSGAWRLRGIPWRAALRLESEQSYLHRVVTEYRIAEMVRANTRRGERILDLETGAAWAYFEATPVVPWQSAVADRAADALRIGASGEATAYWEGTVRWKRQPLLAVRARLVDSGAPGPWSVQELAVLDGGKPLAPSELWEAEARPNSWEAPLAFDGNPVSRWQTWRPASPGMYLALHFSKALDSEGVRMVLFQPQQGTVVAVDGLTVEGTMWRTLAEVPWKSMAARNHRPTAMRAVKREGFRYILARPSDEGLGPIGRDLVERPSDWGLRPVGLAEGVSLLRIE